MKSAGLTSRPFAAGPFAYQIHTNDADDLALIEELLSDVPTPGSGPTLDDFEVLREQNGGETTWRMTGPRIDGPPSDSIIAVLVRLISAINVATLDSDPGALHLHAGAVERDGDLVLVVAARDTGKTTTVAHLVKRGWTFLTDEMVRVADNATDVRGFPKPLSLKPGGWQLVEHLEPHLIPPLVAEHDLESFRFVPIGRSGATIGDRGRARLIVLLRRPNNDVVPPDQPIVRDLHPADAVVALMQETLDAERFGNAVTELAALASTCRCVEVIIGTPEATAARIENLFEEGRSAPIPWSLRAASPQVSPSAVSVAIGDREVIHDTATGQVLALDSAGARVWEHLGRWSLHLVL